MTKNPFYNALAAVGYIILIVVLMNTIPDIAPDFNEYIMPVIMLSLLTFSVALMGYIFGYRPLTMFLDDKKEEAVKLFIQTTLIFGGITLTLIALYLLLF